MARNQLRLDIEKREPFAAAASFGAVGSYERLLGKVHFAIDPAEEGLPYICDLDLAPRNHEGLVEFSGTLEIIKPVELSKGNNRLFYEFSNRGGRSLITRFNDAKAVDAAHPDAAGNGFLMRKGYTVVLSGWQGDLIDNGSNVIAYLPEARTNGEPLRGKVRQEFIAGKAGVMSMGISAGSEGPSVIQPYRVVDASTATLTLREHEREPRVALAQDEWEFAKAQVKEGELIVTPSDVDLHVKGGFRPGWIYELIYETEGSRVMGLGFLGIRDLLAFLRYEAADANGTPNPLAGGIEKTYGWGASLSGRAVRQYIYEGYNVDADGRALFDAVQTHTGSGRLFHNQRFAQVGRFPRQHEDHQWPSERYPFTFVSVPDPFTEKQDAILKRPDSDPIVMHTHTSTDYWQRHVALTHTDPNDGADVEIPATARMYALTGNPHAPANSDAPGWLGQVAANAISPSPYLRACLVLMEDWVTNGVTPPPHRLGRHEDGTLVAPEDAIAKFPRIPGVNLPAGAGRLPLYNYGPDFDKGYVTNLPPTADESQQYPIQVPQVDADGNEVGGLRYPDIEVPLGTYTGWALRKAGYAEGDLLSTSGSFIPFARTRHEREATHDPRPSIEERYSSHDAYVSAVEACCSRLVADRLMLDEDRERLVASARARNPLDPNVALGPLMPGG